MNIQPKFKINDLVQHKFQKPGTTKGNSMKFLEVLFIHTETCSAGTQIFYRVRPFFPICENLYKEDGQVMDIGFGVNTQPSFAEGTYYFREDELKPMSDDEKKFYGLTLSE